MGTYYVAHFSDLSRHGWVSDFRKQYDPKAELVLPHITLVNPISELSNEIIENQVIAVANNTKKFNVIFRSCMMMPETNNQGKSTAYLFLVPDEGSSYIIKLRSQLYQGELKNHERIDIPFIPHITIGFVEDLKKAKKLVQELNSKKIEIQIQLDRMSIVEIDTTDKDRKIIKEARLS